jgi:hypothetical protein
MATAAALRFISLRFLASPGLVAALVAVVVLGQAQYAIAHHLDYIHMDHADVKNVSSSPTIRRTVAEGPVKRDGYDGQFSYFIALDPSGALKLDAYRYTRIGYPLAARALALGRPQWVRGSLIIVNALAIVAATFFLAMIFVNLGLSAWWALLIASYPGLFLVAFTRDTTEPLAYAFALAAVWVYLRAQVVTVRVAAAAGTLFALAALTRETTLLFPIALTLALRKRPAVAATLAAASALPFLAWKAWIVWHFHVLGMASMFTPVPFSGIAQIRPWTVHTQGLVDLTVLVPAVAWTVLALRARGWVVWLVPVNCLFLLFLNTTVFDGYGSTGRVAAGAAVASMVAFPAVRQVWGRKVAVGGVLLWSLPWWLFAGLLVS